MKEYVVTFDSNMTHGCSRRVFPPSRPEPDGLMYCYIGKRKRDDACVKVVAMYRDAGTVKHQNISVAIPDTAKNIRLRRIEVE